MDLLPAYYGNGPLIHLFIFSSISIHNNNKHQIASRQQTDFKNHNFRKNKIITDHDVRSYAYGDDNGLYICNSEITRVCAKCLNFFNKLCPKEISKLRV